MTKSTDSRVIVVWCNKSADYVLFQGPISFSSGVHCNTGGMDSGTRLIRIRSDNTIFLSHFSKTVYDPTPLLFSDNQACFFKALR